MTCRILLLSLTVIAFVSCEKSTGTTSNTPSDTTDIPSEPVQLEDKVIAQNLNHPWELLWGPDNFIWVTERGGRISRVNPDNGSVTPIHTISEVQSKGEGGLLGMAIHPNFSSNPYVYVVYNYNNNGYKEKVVRFTYNNNSLSNPTILLDNIAAANIHNGSRLLIVNNKLFVTTGDAANSTHSQNTSSLNGKILRLNLDGSIPSDNPINNNPVWSWGHRNAQGLVMAGNKMFSSEHGPSSDDEINIIEKGRNYGWPNVQGPCNTSSEQSFCNTNEVREPIKSWTPTIATCGLEYYNSNYIPQWKNSLLLMTLKNSRLYQLKLNDAQTEIVEEKQFYTNKYGRLRDICIAPNGKVYFSTSNGGNDKIIVIGKVE